MGEQVAARVIKKASNESKRLKGLIAQPVRAHA